jgi:hypothetical protein
MDALVEACRNINEEKVIRAITWLVDNEKIEISEGRIFKWIEK